MKHHQYFQILALVFSAASATPAMTRDDVALPTFKPVDCPIDQTSFTLCFNVDYNDAKGSVDLILAKGLEDTPTVLKGHLESNGRKVVIVLKDDFNDEDTIVFKTDLAGGCTRFSVDISGLGETTCLNEEHRPNDDNDVPGGREPNLSDRSLEEIELSPRALDPNGYKLNVAVYYDDMFNEQFGSAAPTRIAAIMAIVDEMYSEKDTLKTEIAVNLVGVEHASGSNWGTVDSWYQRLSPWTSGSPVAGGDLSQIATDSPHEANLYVFLTGSDSIGGLGLATLDSVCNSDRTRRVNVNKYAAGGSKGGDAYTAETVAHEMGHNLGLDHDCLNYNCAYWDSSYVGPRTLNGVECYGYMDYNDTTNYWSACSVADLTLYINRQANGFCLEPLFVAAPTCSDGIKNQDETCIDCGGSCPACPESICTEIKVVTKSYGNENTWIFGCCSSTQDYQDDTTTNEQCCQPAGDYELVCKDSFGDGWHGGYLKINGQEYCKDFDTGDEKKEDATMVNVVQQEICTEIQVVTKTFGNEISWTFGACSSTQEYQDETTTNEQCCQPEGDYELVCKDSFGDGWHGGYLEINEKEYCKEFDTGEEKKEDATMA